MKILKHFFTITRHRHLVLKYSIKLGIFFQGLVHDLSKYSFSEFIPGVKYYEGYRSPTEKERYENGYSKAWMHHKGRNKHHFEYWADIDIKTRQYVPVKMPIRYLKEMLADRIAASIVYLKKDYNDSSPYEYYISHIGKDLMHKETSELLESWLIMLKEKGEKETLKYIRKNYKNRMEY